MYSDLKGGNVLSTRNLRGARHSVRRGVELYSLMQSLVRSTSSTVYVILVAKLVSMRTFRGK